MYDIILLYDDVYIELCNHMFCITYQNIWISIFDLWEWNTYFDIQYLNYHLLVTNAKSIGLIIMSIHPKNNASSLCLIACYCLLVLFDFTHILQGCFTGDTSEATLNDMGKHIRLIRTTILSQQHKAQDHLQTVWDIQYIPRNMHTVLLCFALLWLCNRSQWIHMKYLSIFIRVALLALGQSLDCHSASEVSLMDMGKSVNV